MKKYDTVKPNDTLETIAKRNGISIEKLVELNNLNLSNYFISSGQKLRIE